MMLLAEFNNKTIRDKIKTNQKRLQYDFKYE